MTWTFTCFLSFWASLRNSGRIFFQPNFLFFLWYFLSSLSYADSVVDEEKNKPKPSPIGNFALPSPQRPGGLLSFGQRILNEDQTLLNLYVDYFSGVRKHLTELLPSLTYGITDDLSLNVTVPLTPSNRVHGHTSSGIEDAFIQAEYGFYSDTTSSYEEGATLVASLTFPSGSTKKNPPTGLGSTSPFFGFTYSRMYSDWFAFISDGVLFPTPHHGTKAGNTILYQAGLGRNIFSIKSELTLAWLAELNGFYLRKSKIKFHTDPNSGSNTLYFTPSLQLCTQKLTLQLGFGFPLLQHVNGNQTKNKYLVSSNFIWTF